MKGIGLQPSTTGEPGGKETGQSVTHYVLPGGPLRDGLREAQEFAARAAPMRRGLKRPTISLPAGPPFGSWSGPQNTILNFTQPPCAAGSLVGQQDHLRPLHHPMLTGPSTCPLPQHLLFFGSQANRRPVAHEQIMP
jgi:hypothetical protein